MKPSAADERNFICAAEGSFVPARGRGGGKIVPLRQIHNKIYSSTDKTLPAGGMLQERRVFFVR